VLEARCKSAGCASGSCGGTREGAGLAHGAHGAEAIFAEMAAAGLTEGPISEELGEVGAALMNDGSFLLSLSLGTNFAPVPGFASAGSLSFAGSAPGYSLYAPSNWQYTYLENSVQVIHNAAGLYQVKTTEGLGTVTNANTNGYTLHFYAVGLTRFDGHPERAGRGFMV
jgi:hypothetical protein